MSHFVELYQRLKLMMMLTYYAHVTQTLKAKESVEMANQVVGIDLSDAYYMELKLNVNNKEK